MLIQLSTLKVNFNENELNKEPYHEHCTIIFVAIPRPIASLDPRTKRRIGPVNGDLSRSIISVPTVSPRSVNLCFTFLPPLISRIFPFIPTSNSSIDDITVFSLLIPYLLE